MNRKDEFSWIETAIKIMFVITAILTIAGGLVGIHFIRKFW